MDEAWTKEELARCSERDRLFAENKDTLSPIDKYQRMRYEREIEADEYAKLLKTGYIYKKAAIRAREISDAMVRDWVKSETMLHVEHTPRTVYAEENMG